MFGKGFDEVGQAARLSLSKQGRWTKIVLAVLLTTLLAIGACKYVEMAFAEPGTVFKGEVAAESDFEAQGVVKLNLSYKYSNTGGLAGIDVAAPQTVEAIAEKQDDGTYKVTWDLPTKDGFRIVLDPSELNKYVKNPPKGDETSEELAAALENDDFDVDIEHHIVYYYQQVPGANTNPTYNNRYSNEYNEAWNDARWLRVDGDSGYYLQAVCGDDAAHPHGSENHGANSLVNPKIEVTLTEAQLANAQNEGIDITVNYRRNATWYTVNHWLPKTLCGLSEADWNSLPDESKKNVNGVDYALLDQDTLQGRVDAMTRAVARTSTDNDKADGNPYELVTSLAFSQKLIESTGTTVDIYYAASDTYRVIFDTDYTYIPRQQVAIGSSVDFSKVNEPSRSGYAFDGWRYLKKDATPNADGEYADSDYENAGTKESPALLVSEELIAQAKLQESGGVLALHLVPKWTPTKTKVRVVLWTEDLTGSDDVQAVASGGNTSYYSQKYANYSDAPVTHNPKLGQSDPGYSNIGSFTMEVDTDSSLVASGGGKGLLSSVQNQVSSEFTNDMGKASDIDVAKFYSQENFEIVHEDNGKISYDATTASADGKTTINVYFTRNVYELMFTYYGYAGASYGGNTNWSNYCVATSTNAYSYSGGAAVPNGTLNYAYSTAHEGFGNRWMRANVNRASDMPVPQTITIRAKYGSDLRDVWPVARSGEQVTCLDNDGGRGNVAKMISWGTTDGKYCSDGYPNSGSSHPQEPTIMGTYAGMSAEIVADPDQPSLRHNLVAYWFNGPISYYRNNHCFEVPALNVSGLEKVSIYNNNVTNPRNFLYLVPTDNEAIAKYGFTDLMKVSFNNGQITYDDPNGNYYVVRQHNGKYYAVARQVDTVSSNDIAHQNPSARLHMTRANSNADHSTRYADSDGAYNGTTCGSENDPYDLYFYYDRDRYTVTYMVPSNNMSTDLTEATLGTIQLPYGAQVTKDKHGFALDYKDVNTDSKYAWNAAAQTPVCPDRAQNGTAEWKFDGWALGPAGVNMQWTYDGSGADAASFPIESNLRLYAIWDTPTYDVTFHLNGGTVDGQASDIVEHVPANRRYSSTENSIPRPLRANYTFVGWYIADDDGNIVEPEQMFDFDQDVAANKHVVAKWNAVSTETFDYTIYYVTKNPLDADKTKDKVQIGADGTIGTGDTYYVLRKDERNGQVFIPNSSLNFTAAAFNGYTPQETNRILNMGAATDTYTAMFYYDPITTRAHSVQFVLAGTEGNATPTVIEGVGYEMEADQAVSTPKPADIAKLADMGYELVSKEVDGGNVSYKKVTKASDLTWIDEAGNPQGMGTLSGDAIPGTITYLVQPLSYTVSYVNADGSPSVLDDALASITAPAGTSAANANGKNPTLYSVEDSFDVRNPNPLRVYDDATGKWYEFTGWTLGENTATGDDSDFALTENLGIAAGTVGNLTFVANWREDAGFDLDAAGVGVTKVLAGNRGTDSLKAGEFSFEMTVTGPQDGFTLPGGGDTASATNDADGKVAFGKLSFSKEGTYTVTVKEIVPDTPAAGVMYDEHTYSYNINVASDDATGNLTATVDADSIVGPSAFTNFFPKKSVDLPEGDLKVGDELTYEIAWANATAAAANVGITDVLSDGLTFVSATEGGVLGNDGKTVTWNLGQKAAGETGTVSVTVKVNEQALTVDTSNTSSIQVGNKSSVDTNTVPDFDPATGNLTVTKTVAGDSGDQNKYFDFTVTATDAANNALAGTYGATTFTDGVATFKLKHGESFAIEGLPAGARYSVEETRVDGYKTTIVDTDDGDANDSNANGEGIITANGVAVAAFTNTYGTGGTTIDTDPTGAGALFTKTLNGRDWLASDSFQFVLTADDGEPLPEGATDGAKTVTVTGAANGAGHDKKAGEAVGFGFGTIEFSDKDMKGATENNDGTRSKTFTYKVKETVGKIPGIAYANNTATFAVTVTDDGQGHLTSSFTGTVANGNFVNEYSSSFDYGAKGGLSIAKTLNGYDLQAGKFGFTVKPADAASADKLGIAADGEEYMNPVSAGNGEKSQVKFLGENVEFTQDDAGKTYSYTVSETTGGDVNDGYTNDATVYTVSIATDHDPATAALMVTTTVSDGADEKTYVYTTGADPDGSDAAEVAFVNSYEATGVLGGDVKIEATKTLTGRDLAADEFSFVVTDAKGNQVATGSNTANGNIAFTPVRYTTSSLENAVQNGTAIKNGNVYEFHYEVSEVTSALPGVVSGKDTSFPVVVKVSDAGDGTLTPSVSYPTGMTSLPFANTYSSTSAPVVISGVKWLDGASLASIDGKFTFELTGEQGAPLPANTVAKNDGVGYVNFGEVTFTQADLDGVDPDDSGNRTKTFTYTVTESGQVPGVTNDANATKSFTLTVTDDGQGHIAVVSDPQDTAKFSFTNAYRTVPTESSLTGDGAFTLTKTLTGRDMKDGEFKFHLVSESDLGKVVAQGSNDVDGSVAMSKVKFEKPGSYQYRLLEAVPKTNNGVTYDTSVYAVTATVVDNGDGTLGVKWSVDGVDDGGQLTFANAYKPSKTSIQFNAAKKLKGRDLAKGEFSFELRENGQVLQTAKNAANGTVRFKAVEYTEVGEHDYEIAEVAGNAKGVTYDDTVFTYHVSVTDPGTGKLKASWTVGDNGAPVFVNKFTGSNKPGDSDGSGGSNGGAGNGTGDGNGGLPSTGDTSPIVPLAVVIALAACAAVVAALRMHRR